MPASRDDICTSSASRSDGKEERCPERRSPRSPPIWILAYPTLGAWGAVQAPDGDEAEGEDDDRDRARPVDPVQALGAADHPHQGAEDGHTGTEGQAQDPRRSTTRSYPDATFRSKYINDQALPLLIEEALEIQGPNVETISGATDVTVSFKQSLQGAILAAKKV